MRIDGPILQKLTFGMNFYIISVIIRYLNSLYKSNSFNKKIMDRLTIRKHHEKEQYFNYSKLFFYYSGKRYICPVPIASNNFSAKRDHH